MISDAESAALFDLNYHWGTAFTFAIIDGVWQATSMATLEVLQASDEHELRLKVRRYYAELKERT